MKGVSFEKKQQYIKPQTLEAQEALVCMAWAAEVKSKEKFSAVCSRKGQHFMSTF